MFESVTKWNRESISNRGLGVAAREHKSPGPKTSPISGPHSLRIRRPSGPHCVRMGPHCLRTARKHPPETKIIENDDGGVPALVTTRSVARTARGSIPGTLDARPKFQWSVWPVGKAKCCLGLRVLRTGKLNRLHFCIEGLLICCAMGFWSGVPEPTPLGFD